VIAEYERLNTAEKTRAKMFEQAKRGLWNGGMVPFGYEYERNSQKLLPQPKGVQEVGLSGVVFSKNAGDIPPDWHVQKLKVTEIANHESGNIHGIANGSMFRRRGRNPGTVTSV